jgi:hypothetical protein
MDSPAVSAWEVTRSGRTEVEVLLRVSPGPLVARLSRAELAQVTDVLDKTVAAQHRNEFNRARLSAALREAIGRDPFRWPDNEERQSSLSWWRVPLVLGLGVAFAVEHRFDWWQLIGWGAVAVAVSDLVEHLRRWRRRRAPR